MSPSDLVILGINDSHDASACILEGGHLSAAISEERIQRVKSAGGFPLHAIQACLKKTGLEKSDVDFVVFGNRHVSPTNLHNYFPSLSVFDHIKVQTEYWGPVIYEGADPKLADVLPGFQRAGEDVYPLEDVPFAENRELSAEQKDAIDEMRFTFAADWFGLPRDKIHAVDHHTAHAYFGYYANPLRHDGRDILALTSDAGGDGAYESVSVFRDGRHELLHQGRTNLIASIYSSITMLLGMKPNEHEYKVMGLAAYTPEYHKAGPRELFLDALRVDGLKFAANPAMTDLFAYFRDQLVGYRFDAIAGGVQDFVERLVVQWVDNAVRESGVADISFTGGLAMNIKANKCIWELDAVQSLFVAPGAGDESLPIGAAYAHLDGLTDGADRPTFSAPRFRHWELGTEAQDGEIEALMAHPLIRDGYSLARDAGPEDVAEILAEGEICAVFNGNMEFGPRALGNRSIIADPSKKESVTRINQAIKKRDFWMPFTPSILADRIEDYILNPKKLDCSFMTQAFDTTDLGARHLAGAVHPADLTARPQRVSAETSPDYYAIIKAFEKLTGIGAVLNTSLNIHGKPIVMKPVEIADEILAAEGVVLNYIYVQGNLFRRKVA